MQLGIETLQATGTRQNALILLTDGEETSGEIIEMAETARAAGIEVITIGFGTEEGDFVLDPSFEDGRYRNRDNQTVISRLEPAALERVASITGGRFAIATNGADLPAMVEAAVADLDRVQLAGRETRIVHEYYQWLLLPSILFMFGSIVTATRWRGHSQTIAPLSRTALILLILGFSFIRPEAAQATLFEEARKAMRDHRYDEAVGAYERLATEHEDQEEGFRFSLAQGSAAYKNEDWPTARAAFSNALRSESAEVRDAAHHGLGNTLFQIGWQRLSGGPAYPEIPQPEADQEEGEPPNGMQRLSDALLNMPDDLEQPDADDLMGRFEIMVKLRLSEWMTEDSVGEGQSRGSQRFNDLLTDWIDAIRHHDNATGLEAAAHNRQLTWEYLEKIREILDQTRERAEQVQAIPQSGEGEPQPQPNGQEGEEGNDPNENGSGSGDESEEGGEGGDERDRGQEPRDGESQESDRDPTDNQPKPGETPEEAARRLLKENADLQKGALTPGRRRFRQPEKDW
ncbi:MAG: VWA domain-containing protein [Verrucomicrobiales bacterium]